MFSHSKRTNDALPTFIRSSLCLLFCQSLFQTLPNAIYGLFLTLSAELGQDTLATTPAASSVSNTLCVQRPLCPTPSVSNTLCVLHPLCHNTLCVTTPSVFNNLCVQHPMCHNTLCPTACVQQRLCHSTLCVTTPSVQQPLRHLLRCVQCIALR